MRFWFSGPRIGGIRPGISLSPADLGLQQSAARGRHKAAGDRVEGSFVYVVRGDHNMTKIGVTSNPKARLAQLRTGSPFPIDYAFIGITPGAGYDIEKEAHAYLDQHRVSGEWFDLSPELAISAVMGAAGKLGQPMRAIDLSTCDRVLAIAAGGEDPETPAARRGGPFALAGRAFFYMLVMVVLSAVALSAGINLPDTVAAAIPFVAFALAIFRA